MIRAILAVVVARQTWHTTAAPMRAYLFLGLCSLGSVGLGCGGLDERDVAIANGGSGGQVGVSGSGASSGTSAGSTSEPGAGGSSVGVGGTAADPCAGLPLSRCECSVGEASTCGAEYASIGACGTRVLVCETPGVWPPGSECTPQAPELCDPGQVDDDCDGVVDEGCACVNTVNEGCGFGIGGYRVCAEGAWGDCQCDQELTLDVDANGVSDAEETLLRNGRFTADLVGWLQSQRNNTELDGVLFEYSQNDAAGALCSGSMLLTSTESAGSNFAEQCVAAGSASYRSVAQVVLTQNSGSGRLGSLVSTGNFDPSYVELVLSAFAAPDCGGAVLSEQVPRVELAPDGSLQTLRTDLVAPVGTQSLRVRLNVVADDPGGFQFYQSRAASWDNVLLHSQ